MEQDHSDQPDQRNDQTTELDPHDEASAASFPASDPPSDTIPAE